ncbi:hypothetical protein BGP_0360 [Beggiatoa sp. PS]|nr:hypothetical protein BGP_0360 [Beggiatoa sp. PS]
MHGGQLQVQSQLGVGSQFTFTLPIAKVDDKKIAQPSSQPLQSLMDDSETPEIDITAPKMDSVVEIPAQSSMPMTKSMAEEAQVETSTKNNHPHFPLPF